MSLHSDEEMEEGLCLPDEIILRVGSDESASGSDSSEKTATDVGGKLSADEPMTPGLLQPSERELRERTRGRLVRLLIGYLGAWGLAALLALAFHAIGIDELGKLLDVFVVPILPAVGLVVGFYFGRHSA
ncbi:hypothetical protein [Fodinicola acaciae]|uniref:hypothetical protein n=1 Tax=Fodinicola acaciae TaxID=2681555 RepID=UPI0013D87759|nr:hypothetical protein [Fodinicola acaciae]